MCLKIERKIKNIHPLIAKEDIVVYKHLRVASKRYFTTYQRYEIEFDTLITSDIDIQASRLLDLFYIDRALHSFAVKRECIDDAIEEFEMGASEMVVARCIIPKGSVYYKGTFGNKKSLASDQIIYKKIVKYL